MGIGKASSLLKEVRECVQREEIPLEIAVKGITSNPASILKLERKGHIKVGFDADICLLEEGTLELNTVIAKGQIMVRDGEHKEFGPFQRAEAFCCRRPAFCEMLIMLIIILPGVMPGSKSYILIQ